MPDTPPISSKTGKPATPMTREQRLEWLKDKTRPRAAATPINQEGAGTANPAPPASAPGVGKSTPGVYNPNNPNKGGTAKPGWGDVARRMLALKTAGKFPKPRTPGPGVPAIPKSAITRPRSTSKSPWNKNID